MSADTAAGVAAPYLTWLRTEGGYLHVRALDERRWAAVMPFLFTAAIIVGRLGDVVGYDNRWCYHSEEAARCALEAWDGTGEPEGWHRHPSTGRRINDDGEMDIYA